MRVEFAEFTLADLADLAVQERDRLSYAKAMTDREALRGLLLGPGAMARTAWHEMGVPIACFGVAQGGLGWALLSNKAEECILPVTRAAMRLLEDYTRAKGPVMAQGFSADAERWLLTLGFRHRYSGVWVRT